jgi:hypothetical protein
MRHESEVSAWFVCCTTCGGWTDVARPENVGVQTDSEDGLWEFMCCDKPQRDVPFESTYELAEERRP